MKNLMRDIIFPSFLYSAELDVDLAALKSECLSMREFTTTVRNSNRGGWQSPSTDTYAQHPALFDLQQKMLEFVNLVSAQEQLGMRLSLASSWININDSYAYNVAHSHGGATLIAVFYVNTPHPTSDLVLVRTDGAHLTDTFAGAQHNIKMQLTPQSSRAYVFPPWIVHYVEAEKEVPEPRISIAFNFCTVK